MTQYSRTIGRQITNAYPAWRNAMSATNRLYEVGKRWDDPVHGITAKMTPLFPEATFGGGMHAGADGTFPPFCDSYGGSFFAQDVGPHGTMIYANTGENVIQEQLASWAIGDDDPAFNVFQGPGYVTSAAAATSAGASMYYNRAEFDALPAGKKIPWAAGTGTIEGTWGSTWDKTFPVGREGFIIPGKVGTSLLGNNRPIAGRYNSHVYIPPSMTGTGDGMLVMNERSWHGPFNGHSGPPNLVAPADWYTDVWPSGRRKFYLHGMNVRTKVWSLLAVIPDFVNSWDGNIAQPYAFVDVAAKPVYFTAEYAGHESLYYADFTGGAGAVTVSTPVNMTESDGQAGWSQSHSNADLFVGTSGALAGRKLYFFKNAANTLGMIELGTNTIHRLNVSGLPSGTWLMSLDQANARMHLTVRNAGANTVSVTTFAIPNDPTVAGNYSLSTTAVDMNGITLESAPLGGWQYGSRGTLLTSIGGVVLISQRQGKMLALRPA